MTNVNKINGKQKELMAQFMVDHPSLAKNLIPNCGQGKTVAKRLWDELANKLNMYGPPVKTVSVWRKVFADQKHNAKKKLSFNKESKRKTGGGPYEEMLLSPPEEQIIQVAGIEAAVEGVSGIKTFGKPKSPNENICNESQSLKALLYDDSTESEDMVEETPRIKKLNSKAETKLSLLTSNLSKSEIYHSDLIARLDRLIEIKEKSLKLKEEEQSANMAIKNIDLQIKTIELEMIKKKQG